MNYIKHLSAVFEKMDADTRITPYHISLYMTLFRRWNLNFFRNPISVSRDELMRLSKIGSVNTYTKCLKQLDQFGYIQYIPSYNPHKGSLINLYTFSKGSDKGNEIAVRPFKNNTNSTNNKNMREHSQKNSNDDFKKSEMKKKEKLREKKKISDPGYGPDIPPKEDHVKIYFSEKGCPQTEAEKFYNYYQSNGWLIGGKTEMKDWKAAARNWILNIQKFNNNGNNKRTHKTAPTPGRLNTNINKNYSEPL